MSNKSFTDAHIFRYEELSDEEILGEFEVQYKAANKENYTSMIESYAVYAQQNMHINEIQKYAFVPPHCHNCVEINYVYTGLCYQYIDRKLIRLNRGDFLILSPTVRHQVYLPPSGLGRNICIRTNEARSIANDLNRHTVKNYLNDILDTSTYYIFHTQNEPLLTSLLTELYKYSYKNISLSSVEYLRSIKMISLILSELHFKSIASELPYESNSVTLHPTNADYFEITQYIRENLKTVSRKKVEIHFGLSTMTLYRLFQANGTTFQAFVQHTRERKAIYLLKYSKLSIGEIAAELGFESPEYFCRFFKKIRSVSPSEFQRKYRENGMQDLQSNI